MNLNDLQAAATFLSAAALADPILALCSSLAWLDPLVTQANTFLDDFETPYIDTDDAWLNIAFGWDIARRCFPAVYAETTLGLRMGASEAQISSQLCQGINQHLGGVELHDLEQLHFGLPFVGMGIDITSPEFFGDPDHAPLVQLYALFDVTVGEYTIPEGYPQAAQVAHVLAYSLRETEDTHYGNLAWLLDWMFAQTGNTAADYTDNDLFEMGLEPLPWQPDEIEFNTQMHTEAAEILTCVQQGMTTLLNGAALQATLHANIETIASSIRKVNRYDFSDAHAHRLAKRIRWADRPEPVDANRTAPDIESLSLWGADAA